MPVTRADIDAAVNEVEALREPLDAQLRVETRQLDTEIRANLNRAINSERIDAGAKARLLAAVDTEMDKRANSLGHESPDADKRIHERERQFGSQVKQIINRLGGRL